jgi:uncharacterized protein YndB with AHSA1/START domain
MTTNQVFGFVVDKENRTIRITREFDAELPLVWKAYTDSSILDQWWAPKPWRTRTKSMDFRPGGEWRYAMVGPEGEEHWCVAKYEEVIFQKSYKGLDAFTDAQGHVNTEMPQAKWQSNFISKGDKTIVEINISYDSLADLEGYIQMGFKEGLSMAMENLDQLLPTLNR